MKDTLGDRMKKYYENRFRLHLPRRTYTIIRLDGKAFHTVTRHLEKPFDNGLITAFRLCAQRLVQKIQGSIFAYHQSDEISIVLQDFANIDTDAWFDGNIQKICSVSASMFTLEFCKFYDAKYRDLIFDARCFIIPDKEEVINYFIWRQQDWIRNSLNMLCSKYFSHEQLKNKSNEERHELLHSKGINWNDLALWLKNGSVIFKDIIFDDIIFKEQRIYMRNILNVPENISYISRES